MSGYITEIDINNCQVEITRDAFELREAAIKSAAGIESVENLFEANKAKDALDALAELSKGIEASRKSAKEPALKIGRKIDAIAKDFIDLVNSEKNRMQKILGAYQRVEADKKRKAEEEARREEQRIIDQAQAEHEKRCAKEKDGRTGELLKDIQEISELADKKILEARQVAANKHDSVQGLRVRKTLKFEIKDVEELLKARPDLFSPNESKIRSAIKLTKNIPGLEVWEESKAY